MPANPSLKLLYFDLPGKAETSRLLLTIGGVPFEDATFPFSDWPSIKPTTPYGQCPVLFIDGKALAQSSAIERYCSKLAGLTPTEPFEEAKHDEVLAFLQEIQDLFLPAYVIKDPEAKAKARGEVCAGPLREKFAKLSAMIEQAGGKFLMGGNITYADVACFKNMSGLAGGSMDGVPTTVLDDFPAIKAHHNRVAEVEAVKAFYSKYTEGVRLAYKPLP